MSSPSTLPSAPRRRFLAAQAALAAVLPFPGAAAAQSAAGTGADGSRLALLIGNRDYPGGQDLPPMHTNVRDLQAALQGIGFEVTPLLDQDRAGATQAVEAFKLRVEAMPADGVALFYFCGHGMQVDAENFLLPSRVYPRERSLKDSLDLYVALWRHVVERIPRRPSGLTITVVDACRTSPKPLSADDGLNQVRAPDGELIVFSTGAGRPALAPIDDRRRTFFTDALVRQIERQASHPEELSFRELFRLVSADVQQTMRNHPVEDIRELVQIPFIADNSGRPIRVSAKAPAPTPSVAETPTKEDALAEEEAFNKLRDTLWPSDVLKLAREFATRYPRSRFASAATVARLGAEDAYKVLYPASATAGQTQQRIGLERRDFQARPELGDAYNEDLRRAARGDKDAAARLGARLKSTDRSGPAALRYEDWMKFAAELGNGIASFELSRYYLEVGAAAQAARWEARAKQLGFNPPPELRKTR